MKTFSFLLCIVFLACLNCASVWSLSCAQCNQHDPACRSGSVLPTLCSGGERYCFVFNLYTDGRQGTFRGCTNSDNNEGCRTVAINIGSGTGCLSVCSWEGCNSSQGGVLALLMKNR